MSTPGVKKGEKRSAEKGYSKQNEKLGPQNGSRPNSEGTGQYNIMPAQTLKTTTKLTHLGTQIDIVKTTSGHYVSRKMIEQLREQHQQKLNPIVNSKLQADQTAQDNSPYNQSQTSNSRQRKEIQSKEGAKKRNK